jgi:hypothetical protein
MMHILEHVWTWPIIIVFVVLSPDSPLELRMAGRPATFIDNAEYVPDGAAAHTASCTKARRPIGNLMGCILNGGEGGCS